MKAAGPIPKMLENIKTLAINKSEVSGKLFRESTTVTVSMLEYKASMSRSKHQQEGDRSGESLL